MNYTPIPGRPATVRTEAETLSMIRTVLTEEEPKPTRSPRRPVLGKLSAPKPKKSLRFAPLKDQEAVASKPKRKMPAFSMPRMAMPKVSMTKARLPMPNVRRGHLTLACLAGILFLQPAWILLPALAVAGLIVLAFVLGGGDRIWKGVLVGLREIGEKEPERASRIRARLDRFAMGWDRVLDVFPDGSVDRFYMPDFQSLDVEDMDHTEIVNERLTRLRHQA